MTYSVHRFGYSPLTPVSIFRHSEVRLPVHMPSEISRLNYAGRLERKDMRPNQDSALRVARLASSLQARQD